MQEVQQVELKKSTTPDSLADVFNTYNYSYTPVSYDPVAINAFKELVRELGVRSFTIEIEEQKVLNSEARGGITTVKVKKIRPYMLAFLINVLGLRIGTENLNIFDIKNSYSCFNVFSPLRARDLKNLILEEKGVESFHLIAQERVTESIKDSYQSKVLASKEGYRSELRLRITGRHDMSWRRLIYKKLDDERREFEEAKITELD